MPGSPLSTVPAHVLDAAQRIWLAGLGAMVLAQDEGNKVVKGTGDLVSTLVEKGLQIEKAGMKQVQDVTGVAGEAWSRVQVVIDAQVSQALHRLGVPTRQEIADLTKRIDKLTASIDALKPRR